MAEDQPSRDTLTASTAILAAVAAATLASNAQANPEDPVAPKREFGTVAYERVLPEGDCHCVETTATKLLSLDTVVHVWVRDARSFRHGSESSVPYFSLRVAASISISDLRHLVQEQFTFLSPYRKEVDGELQLCFDNRMLDDDEAFTAYLPGGSISSLTLKAPHSDITPHRQPSWPKPFAGILWVLPWRPSRKQPLQWGTGESSTGNAQIPKPKQEQNPQN
ncbi:hypothetical protein PRNP1_006262 [Phytophthora ramorum]